MNPLLLTEHDASRLAPMPDAIAALEECFRLQAAGSAFTNCRQRLRMPAGMLHMMAGALPDYFGYKAYTSLGGKPQFLFFLFDATTAELLAIMQADTLGQIRTGAASGLATRLMSNDSSTEATLFGAGWQARTQLLAIDAVRTLKTVRIVNRNAERRRAFIERMQPLVKASLIAAESAEDAVRQSHIVTTMTSSREPVLKGAWLPPGAHVNAAGSNMLVRREIDTETVIRAGQVVVDSIEQARLEAGEFISVIDTGKRRWQDFAELSDVVSGQKPGRTSESEITLFKSLGLALEDVAVGKLIYERALECKAGNRIELFSASASL